eukprot:s819_g5.t1
MLGGSQQPIDIILHSCVCSTIDKNFTSYRKTRKLFEMVPQAFFGHIRCPPEGEVDVLVIGDSSTALVDLPDDPKNRKVLSIGELLKGSPPAEVRNVYTKMRWGKGLGSIVAGIWEAMDEINRDCDEKGIERKRVLVMIGWAGNDVYGDHGYRGCSWIHERRYNQTPADRKVSAEFVEKQYNRVQKAVNDLIKLKGHGQILDLVVFGCGDASAYGLQPSYQVEMWKWFDILVDNDLMCIPTDMVSMASIRYDKLHMEDIPYNRKLVSRWLKAAIRMHLFAMKLDVASDELYRCDMPKSLAQEAQTADESIMEFVAAAVDEAETEATREGAPKAVEFTNEELEAVIPVFKEDENSDDEEVRIRRHLQEDFDEAVDAEEKSPVHDAQEDIPDLDSWETLEQTRTDVVHNPYDDDDMAASKDTIVVDYDTDHDIDVIPEEPKEGEKATEPGTATERKEVPTVVVEMEVDEGKIADKEAMDVEKKDVTEATDVNQPKPEEVVATTEETKADEPKPTEEEKPESKEVITIPDDDASSQLAGRPAVSEPEPSAPTAKDDKPEEAHPKPAEPVEKAKKPEAKKMPRSHHTAAAPESQLSEQVKKKLEEAKERLEDAVWLDPRDLDSRIPYKRIEGNGRLRAISHKMSFYLRGHALADDLPSPEMNFNDLSMDWNKLREYLDTKVWNVKDWEMLQVIRSSDTRRFQVQVSQPINAASWEGLPWQPVNVRTFQGHNAYVLGKGRFGPMIKELYSLDPEYTVNQVSENGLIPGGWPKPSGRAHNYFIATHPWDANMRKLAGTRAGKPYYVAFDVELMVQTGVRLFRTDEAIMSPDWVPNEAIICIYDAANREFLWSNRAYASSRKTYNEQVKAHIEAGTTVAHALQQSKIGIAKDSLSAQWGNFLKGVRPGRFFTLNSPRILTGVFKDMETDAKTEAVELKNYLFALYAAMSNSDVIIRQRRGKGYGGKGKGHGSLPGGKAADVSTQIKLENLRTEHCIAHQKIAVPYVNCEKCGHRQLDGLAKCESCYVSQESWPDSRIATEVSRLESRAEEISGAFSIDQISSQQPRRHRVGSEKRQKSRAGRSNFGVMKDGARNEIRKLRKTGFASIRQRLEGVPFFMYNCSLAQLTPPACDFLHRLGTCLSPDSGRSFTARDQGKGTDMRTRLIFMPMPYRDPSTPLDVTKESMICHSGRFFSLAQFAVYTAKLAPARGEPAPTVFGWSGQMLVLDEQPLDENYNDLVSFAKTNWTDHHGAMKWEQYTTEPEAVASEVKNFPEAVGPKKQEGMIDRPKRNFDPRTTEAVRPAARSWGSSSYYENGCYICGSLDHWQRDCPQKKGGWQSGKGYGGGRWDRWGDDRQWGYGGKGYGYREHQSQQRSKGKGSGQKGYGYRDQGYQRTYSGRSYPGGPADRERSPPPSGGATSSDRHSSTPSPSTWSQHETNQRRDL